jgi:hypothetical protein
MEKYRDNRDVVLELVQVVIGVIGDDCPVFPTGGAITSKFLESLQVNNS